MPVAKPPKPHISRAALKSKVVVCPFCKGKKLKDRACPCQTPCKTCRKTTPLPLATYCSAKCATIRKELSRDPAAE